MLTEFIKLLFLSIACGAISMTISKAKIFKPSRQLVMRFSAYLGEGLSCPYCTSHWVSALLMLIYFPQPLHSSIGVVDFFVGMMIMVALAAITSWGIFSAYSGMSEGSEHVRKVLGS